MPAFASELAAISFGPGDAGVLLLVVLPATALLLGIALLARGMRGRRVGDHPHCRPCGFDLFGLPPAQVRCPECGADLLAGPAKAVAIGRRLRRVPSLSAGLALLAPALLVLTATTVAALKGSDSDRWKPAWWLLLDLNAANPNVAKPAAVELWARLKNGNLSPEYAKRAGERVLAIQADTRRPWSVEFGDFAEDAHQARHVTREAWNRYLLQGMVAKLDVNPVVRRDADFPVRIVLAPAASAAGSPRTSTGKSSSPAWGITRSATSGSTRAKSTATPSRTVATTLSRS